MKYKWVLFDADETLFKFDNFAGLQRLFRKYDVGFSRTDFEEYQSVNKPLWVDYQNGKITAEELQTRRFTQWSNQLGIKAEVLNAQFLDCMADICVPLPGAEELLNHLHQNKIKIGIITNGFAQLQNVRLERTGLDKYISLLVISELVGAAKPDAKIFQYAFNQMPDTKKAEVLMVGDTLESDILGGNNFGFDTFWLNHKEKMQTEIVPTFEINNLTELLEYLGGNNF